MENKRFYSLQFMEELKKINTIHEVNRYIKEGWLLLEVTTNQKNNFVFLIGRVK